MTYFLIKICFAVCAIFTKLVYGSTCSVSVPATYAVSSQEFSFSGVTNTYSKDVEVGPTSKDAYFNIEIASGTTQCVIRRVTSADSLVWMAAFNLICKTRGLVIDSNEQYLYVAIYGGSVSILKLYASTGNAVDYQTFPFTIGSTSDTKVNLLSDNTGYYVIGAGSGNTAAMCKYLFSSPTTSQCQTVYNIYQNAFGLLMLSNTDFYLYGSDNNSPYTMYLYRFTFGSTSVSWANIILCSSGSCLSDRGFSYLSSDSTQIYSFFFYGNTRYFYMATFLANDGSVSGSRYKSNEACSYSNGSTKKDNYIFATLIWYF